MPLTRNIRSGSQRTFTGKRDSYPLQVNGDTAGLPVWTYTHLFIGFGLLRTGVVAVSGSAI
jgi:hypothetical protein